MWNDRILIGLAGGFGGIAPSLVDLAGALHNRDLSKWYEHTTSVFWALVGPVCAFLIYFTVGAVVVLAFKERQHGKAIMLGVSAPALVISWLNSDNYQQSATLADLFLFQTASAADALSNEGILEIVPLPQSRCPNCQLRFYSEDGTMLDTYRFPSDNQFSYVIPPGSSALGIYGTHTNPNIYKFPKDFMSQAQEPNIRLNLSRERNYWNDFYRALGKDSIEPYDFKVDPEWKGLISKHPEPLGGE